MPKTKISEFSATPANNTDIDSINIAEGCAPSGINDAIRELMAQLKDFQTGAVGDSFNGPVGTTTAAAGAFTTLSSTGNTTLGDASGDSVTINGTATFANANPTLSAGTANGVAYLNGSKVVTSGSALTYNGTNLSLDAAGAGPSYLEVSQRSRFGYDGTNVFISDAGTGKDIVFTRISEQMRLTSTGLGIGTSSPAQKLHVENNANSSTWIKVANTNSGSGAAAGVLFANNGGDLGAISLLSSANSPANSLFLRSLSTNTLTLGTNNTVQATLDSSGNLGLGVTPSAWFTSNNLKAFQLGGGSLVSYLNNQVWLASNYYLNSSGADTYVATGAANRLIMDGAYKFFTAPSGTAGNAITFTQAMTLDASGNLGVGTTSPATRLEVNGVSEGEYFRAGGGTISARSLQFSSFTVSGLAGVGHQINVPNASGVLTFATGSTERARIDSSGNFLVGTTSSNLSSASRGVIEVNGASTAYIGLDTGGTLRGTFYSNGSIVGLATATLPLTFGTTGGTEWGRFDTSGSLLVGLTSKWASTVDNEFRATSASNWALNVNSTNTGSGDMLLVTTGRNNGSPDQLILCETNHSSLGGSSTTVRFKVDGSGTIYATNTTVQSASDVRLKENITDSTDGLNVIIGLRPRRFDWKEGFGDNKKNVLGFVAQEVETVFAEAVGVMPASSSATGNEEQYKTVGPAALIPVLVKAIQEQQTIINSLKARLDAANL